MGAYTHQKGDLAALNTTQSPTCGFNFFFFIFLTLWFFLSPSKIAPPCRPRWRVVVPKYYRSSAAGNIWCLFSQLLLAPVFPGFASHTDVFPSDIFRMLKLTFGTKSEWLVPKVRPDALHMGCSNTPIGIFQPWRGNLGAALLWLYGEAPVGFKNWKVYFWEIDFFVFFGLCRDKQRYLDRSYPWR